jgi:ferritin-like metal-binding protein YciE
VANPNARDAKLIQYLNEAYGKEKQLETALEAHIEMATKAPYRKRLKEHLRETKTHAREVQRRIKQLGGKAESVPVPGPDILSEAASTAQEVAQRGVALAQGPLHVVRGTGEEEKQLKNAKTEYSDEAEEIANYTAIETLAESVGDRETARLAKGIRAQEERMAGFLSRVIKQLTKAVAQAEIPAAERSTGRRSTGARATSRRGTTARRTSGTRRTTGRATTRRSSGRATTRRTSKRTTGARSTSRRTSSGRSTARRTTARSSSPKRSTSARSTTARRTTARRSTGARSASGRSKARTGRS